jgi:hypothetical protein
MASNPHWFRSPIGNPHWLRRKEEEAPHLHTGDNKVKLEGLRSARVNHHDQKTTTRQAKALSKAKGLTSLLAPTLTTIKHDFSHLKLINMIRFASYFQHAKVSNQILINIKP